ncbi:hypothetical protein GRI38_13365 [Altererythrobacter aurantiacus]|uniref:GDT1 family protein n=1 Tax=Parapontixanthobacter aurantiacus TaxID=1463599 RepID=A0A844ZJC9_9SPHN|nr:hypothetical protein [Parapontixanthobacter aurantiacus]MXO87017.1 hypothetical protein [Parapontixanthobacter aurantiacus]
MSLYPQTFAPTLAMALVVGGLIVFGSRAERLASGLGRSLGKSLPFVASLLAAAIVSASSATLGHLALRAFSGELLLVLTAGALFLAGIRLLIWSEQRLPAEPTRSLGAATLALSGLLVFDAAPLVLFALTMMTGQPVAIAIGGMLGIAAGIALSRPIAAKDRVRIRYRFALAPVLFASVAAAITAFPA